MLQRKPVKPLRALCPDQVGDEGIDVVAPGQAAQAEPVEIGGQVLFKIMVVSFLPKT